MDDDTSNRDRPQSCLCPLCAVFKTNVANVQRWANDRSVRQKSKYDEKLQGQRAYHESILHKLRDKHAMQIQSFDDLIQVANKEDATTTAELESQYNNELQLLNANLKHAISEMITGFKKDYHDRTSHMEGFDATDETESPSPTGAWGALYYDKVDEPPDGNETVQSDAVPEPGVDARVELVVDEQARLRVVRRKSTLID